MDACLHSVSLPFPSRHFLSNLSLAVQVSVQALTIPDADLRLGHVQPAAMFRRVVPGDLVQQTTGLFGRKRLLQIGTVMGVPIVLYQPDLLGLGIVVLDQLTQAPSIVFPSASLTDLDMSPTPQRFTQHQLVANSLTLVLVVLLGWTTRPRRQSRSYFSEQLFARLVETDYGYSGSYGRRHVRITSSIRQTYSASAWGDRHHVWTIQGSRSFFSALAVPSPSRRYRPSPRQ
jgi:hypothetical protein